VTTQRAAFEHGRAGMHIVSFSSAARGLCGVTPAASGVAWRRACAWLGSAVKALSEEEEAGEEEACFLCAPMPPAHLECASCLTASCFSFLLQPCASDKEEEEAWAAIWRQRRRGGAQRGGALKRGNKATQRGGGGAYRARGGGIAAANGEQNGGKHAAWCILLCCWEVSPLCKLAHVVGAALSFLHVIAACIHSTCCCKTTCYTHLLCPAYLFLMPLPLPLSHTHSPHLRTGSLPLPTCLPVVRRDCLFILYVLIPLHACLCLPSFYYSPPDDDAGEAQKAPPARAFPWAWWWRWGDYRHAMLRARPRMSLPGMGKRTG